MEKNTMSNFFESVFVGFAVGMMTSSIVCSYITHKVTESHLKDAHCKHIQLRIEYDKCYEEFGETK
jgi:zinc transporter ZupT